MRIIAVLAVVLWSTTAAAQIQTRPTDPPLVTAANDSWYILGEPVQFAGELYYRAGATVFFNGNTMVRTGHYNGVPLYADTTVEPFSVVLVPISRGVLQPYERPRRGQLVGTSGSRASSFPTALRPDASVIAMAPGLQPRRRSRQGQSASIRRILRRRLSRRRGTSQGRRDFSPRPVSPQAPPQAPRRLWSAFVVPRGTTASGSGFSACGG